MVSAYIVGYLLYPSRILRTARNIFSHDAATVFEHRLKDALNRFRLLAKSALLGRTAT